jgi:molybdopterin converting factor small subunit
MKVTIKLMGDILLKDKLGKSEILLELSDEEYTLYDVIEMLIQEYPNISEELRGDEDRFFYQFSINDHLIHPSELRKTKVRHGDRVTIFPAIGGGSLYFSILLFCRS